MTEQDLERVLVEDGAAWRASAPPALPLVHALRRVDGPQRARRIWPVATTAAAVVVLAAGVALVRAQTSDDAPSRPGATAAGPNLSGALARWADFPVGRRPRPLVLTGELVLGPQGFATVEQKEAFLAGAITLALPLPAPPATRDGFPVIQGAAAVELIRRQGSGPAPPTTLTVSAASLTTASFGTDRGPRLLPAWEYRFTGVATPVDVLAVDPRSYRAQTGSELPTTIDPTDLVLTFHLSDRDRGFSNSCAIGLHGTVAESRTAVAVAVERSGLLYGHACDAVPSLVNITVRLATPLGNRVLVTATGAPISVTTR